ncbi:MAG: response regulator [Treponema sp.]|nr:response regulator [Treponema sp.]
MADKIKKPVIYSALEVANICGVVNQTAINWINSGYLTAFKTPGGQYRVYPDDLIDFMSKRNMHIPQELLNASSKKHRAAPSTILIIDDDKTFNALVTAFVQERFPSLEVIQAFDGFEAGVQLSTKKPHCIMLDLDLPGVDGFELCRKINESTEYGKPAIIVVTALDSEEDEAKVRALGVERFFRKPLIFEEFGTAIERVFNG